MITSVTDGKGAHVPGGSPHGSRSDKADRLGIPVWQDRNALLKYNGTNCKIYTLYSEQLANLLKGHINIEKSSSHNGQ